MTTFAPAQAKLPYRLTIAGDRQTGKTHAALLYAVNEAHAGNRVLVEVRFPEIDMHDTATLIKQLGLDITRKCVTHGKRGIRFDGGGHIHFRLLGLERREGIKNQYDVHIIDREFADDRFNYDIIGVQRVIDIVTITPSEGRHAQKD